MFFSGIEDLGIEMFGLSLKILRLKISGRSYQNQSSYAMYMSWFRITGFGRAGHTRFVLTLIEVPWGWWRTLK